MDTPSAEINKVIDKIAEKDESAFTTAKPLAKAVVRETVTQGYVRAGGGCVLFVACALLILIPRAMVKKASHIDQDPGAKSSQQAAVPSLYIFGIMFMLLCAGGMMRGVLAAFTGIEQACAPIKHLLGL